MRPCQKVSRSGGEKLDLRRGATLKRKKVFNSKRSHEDKGKSAAARDGDGKEYFRLAENGGMRAKGEWPRGKGWSFWRKGELAQRGGGKEMASCSEATTGGSRKQKNSEKRKNSEVLARKKA